MNNLKEMLLQEQTRLRIFLDNAEKRLEDTPEGSLYITTTRKWVQYYQHMPGGNSCGNYIPKSNQTLIRKLAQKSYDKKLVKLARKRLAQLEKITKDYENDEIERIYLKEHPEKQKLICPAEPTWEQTLQEWAARDYKKKSFSENTPVIFTEHGEQVRSKSEKILADLFHQCGIPYKYECPLKLNGLGIIHPDFTFLSRKTRQEVYWEHHGMIDDPIYAQSAVRRIQGYENNGIYPGERLILTFETAKTVLDTRLAKELIYKYLY